MHNEQPSRIRLTRTFTSFGLFSQRKMPDASTEATLTPAPCGMLACRGCENFACVREISMFTTVLNEHAEQWMRAHRLTYEAHRFCPKCGREDVLDSTEFPGSFQCRRPCRKLFAMNGPYITRQGMTAVKFIMLVVGHWKFNARHEELASATGLNQSSISINIEMIEDRCSAYEEERNLEEDRLREAQIDEVCWGGRKYNAGKRTNKLGTRWFLTIAETKPEFRDHKSWLQKKWATKTTRVWSIPVLKRDKKTLEPIIRRKCGGRTRVYTDCWKAYSTIEDFVREHCTVNHSKTYVDKKTGHHTNNVEGCHSMLKKIHRRLHVKTSSEDLKRINRIVTNTTLLNAVLEGNPGVCGIFRALREGVRREKTRAQIPQLVTD